MGIGVSKCCPEYVPTKQNMTANESLITVPLGWEATLFLGPNGKYNFCKLIFMALGVETLTGFSIVMYPVKSLWATLTL